MLSTLMLTYYSFFFFFNDTATTEIYTLSLHDALPILHADNTVPLWNMMWPGPISTGRLVYDVDWLTLGDRKSTRLNSSHLVISYAVFCLKKKKTTLQTNHSYVGRRGQRSIDSSSLVAC